MDASEIAAKLKKLIDKGRLRRIELLLDGVISRRFIKDIDEQFTITDAVNYAIESNQEDIACYLVEKGFPIDTLHQKADCTCTEECRAGHGPKQCPTLYDALDNTNCHNFLKLKQLLTDVREGHRRPGESLYNETWYQPRTPMPPKYNYALHERLGYEDDVTEADVARQTLLTTSIDFVDKDKNTLLHASVRKSAAFVYVFANSGVPVNLQNENGDTALHLAARHGRLDTANALLRCGADLSIKNKLGETPMEEGSERMSALLKMYQPGLPMAIVRGNAAAVCRLVRNLWCSMTSIIKENKNALELAESMCRRQPEVVACLRILEEHQRSNELVHAVLCEDTDAVCGMLATDRNWCINTRCGDRHGDSLLSHAIGCHNYRLAHSLICAGAHVDGVRVRRHLLSSRTVPLMNLALQKTCPIELAVFLHSRQSASEQHEKDYNGNTPLLVAVSRNLPTEWITWLLTAHSGYNITDRNRDGLTARDIAKQCGNTEAMDAIDDFVCSQVGKLFLYHLPVSFYGEDNLSITDQKGRTLSELVDESGCSDDRKILRHYAVIEEKGRQLFEAAKTGNMAAAKSLNNANFRDKNGYTALTLAIVHDQFPVAELLCTERPMLKVLPDNCNRYPLHYAYALPDEIGLKFVQMLLKNSPQDVEKRTDMNGLQPVEYRQIRDTEEITSMITAAKTLSIYGPEATDASQC